jgi:hypothetical protein
MPHSKTTLVELPTSLCDRLDRRLPRGGKFKDLTGKRFENCRVVGFAGYRRASAAWLCKCDCGTPFVVVGAFLTQAGRWSCDCARGELSPGGKSVYHIIGGIRSRCYRPTDPNYRYYGARGITVCKRWRDSTEAFHEDMGPRPSMRHVVVRRDKRGNYTPRNCYWGTRTESARGRTRGAAREITYKGRTLNLTQWAARLGITREAMRIRVNKCLERGLDPVEAIVNPPRVGRPKNS